MSHHMDERNKPELDDLLRLHRMATDTPSQLSDAFRLGYWAAQAEIARLQAEVDAVKEARDMMGRLWQSARNDALEEAAKIAFLREQRITGEKILALKDKP